MVKCSTLSKQKQPHIYIVFNFYSIRNLQISKEEDEDSMRALSIESQMKMHILVGIKKVLRFDSQSHLSVSSCSGGKVTVPALYSLLMLVSLSVLPPCVTSSLTSTHTVFSCIHSVQSL